MKYPDPGAFSNFTPHPKPSKSTKKDKKPLPKYGKKWKKATPAELKYLEEAHNYGCMACTKMPVEVNHITSGSKRLGHFYAFPLCHEHHEGKFSIGNAKKPFIAKYGSEIEILERFWNIINFDKGLLSCQ